MKLKKNENGNFFFDKYGWYTILFIHFYYHVSFLVLFSRSSFYGILFPFSFALRSWGVVYLLFCNNIFLNTRIFFFAGTRRLYVPRDNVFGRLQWTLCAVVDILSYIDLVAVGTREA